MSETNNYLRDEFKKAKNIGSDPSLSAGEAMRTVTGMARDVFATAVSYKDACKQRKTAVAARVTGNPEEMRVKATGSSGPDRHPCDYSIRV